MPLRCLTSSSSSSASPTRLNSVPIHQVLRPLTTLPYPPYENPSRRLTKPSSPSRIDLLPQKQALCGVFSTHLRAHLPIPHMMPQLPCPQSLVVVVNDDIRPVNTWYMWFFAFLAQAYCCKMITTQPDMDGCSINRLFFFFGLPKDVALMAQTWNRDEQLHVLTWERRWAWRLEIWRGELS